MAFITRDYLNNYFNGLPYNRKLELRARPNVLVESQKASYKATIFLSHSHKDKDLVEQVALFLMDQGVYVYVDWKDSSMPEITSATTANNIKSRIRTCDSFIVLASNNAIDSKWVPWELGFADAAKGINNVYIFPVADNNGVWRGSEYFDLYQKVEIGLKAGSSTLEGMVREPINAYSGISLKRRLNQNTDSATFYR